VQEKEKKLRFCYFNFKNCKVVSVEAFVALTGYLSRRSFTYYFNRWTQDTVHVSIGSCDLSTLARTWDGFNIRTKRLTIKVLKE